MKRLTTSTVSVANVGTSVLASIRALHDVPARRLPPKSSLPLLLRGCSLACGLLRGGSGAARPPHCRLYIRSILPRLMSNSGASKLVIQKQTCNEANHCFERRRAMRTPMELTNVGEAQSKYKNAAGGQCEPRWQPRRKNDTARHSKGLLTRPQTQSNSNPRKLGGQLKNVRRARRFIALQPSPAIEPPRLRDL